MAADFDLSCINDFEVELGSSLRRCCNASRKLKLLISKDVELKLNNQVNLKCKSNNADLSVKNILDDVQNIRSKLNTIKTTVDCSDKPLSNIEEFIEELENIVNIISKNKNTIFSHRNLL